MVEFERVVRGLLRLVIGAVALYAVYFFYELIRILCKYRETTPRAEHDIEMGRSSCSVCRSVLGSGEDVIALRTCNHSFHFRCVVHEAARTKKCPLCGAAAIGIRLINVSDESETVLLPF